MPVLSYVSAPLPLLAGARFAPAVKVPGGVRPSGSRLTGSDLGLLLLVLDGAGMANAPNVMRLPQATITHALQRQHPGRIIAALKRLRGTDIMLGANVMPAVVAFDHVGRGTDPRYWDIKLDRRVVELVRASIRATQRIDIKTDDLRSLTSRYSFALYGRWLAMLAGEFPRAEEIGLRAKRPVERTIEVKVPVEILGEIFGYYTPLRQSEIERWLVTKAKTCAIGRELRDAGVAADIVPLREEATGRIDRLVIMLTAIGTKGLAYLQASQRHASILAGNRRERRLAREKAAI